jgi:hypothetical protein
MSRQDDDLIDALRDTSPCGCDDATAAAADTSTSSLGEVPSLGELNRLAEELAQDNGGDGSELELALAESDLGSADGLQDLAFAANEETSLERLLAFASSYPGLKITLSF